MERKFEINAPLQETIQWEKNLSQEAKDLFGDLCDNHDTATKDANAFVELIQRNYVWIPGFPASAPVPGRNRTAFANRLRGLKQFFTGREE